MKIRYYLIKLNKNKILKSIKFNLFEKSKMDCNIYEKAKKKTKDYYAKAGVAAGGDVGKGVGVCRRVFLSHRNIYKRNSIYTPCSSLYTPLKITIDENTNLPLNLLYTPHLRLFLPHFFLLRTQFISSSEVCSFKQIVRIGENGVEK